MLSSRLGLLKTIKANNMNYIVRGIFSKKNRPFKSIVAIVGPGIDEQDAITSKLETSFSDFKIPFVTIKDEASLSQDEIGRQISLSAKGDGPVAVFLISHGWLVNDKPGLRHNSIFINNIKTPTAGFIENILKKFENEDVVFFGLSCASGTVARELTENSLNGSFVGFSDGPIYSKDVARFIKSIKELGQKSQNKLLTAHSVMLSFLTSVTDPFVARTNPIIYDNSKLSELKDVLENLKGKKLDDVLKSRIINDLKNYLDEKEVLTQFDNIENNYGVEGIDYRNQLVIAHSYNFLTHVDCDNHHLLTKDKPRHSL